VAVETAPVSALEYQSLITMGAFQHTDQNAFGFIGADDFLPCPKNLLRLPENILADYSLVSTRRDDPLLFGKQDRFASSAFSYFPHTILCKHIG